MHHLKNKFLTTCLLMSTTSQAMLIKRLTLSTNRFPSQTARHISRSYSYKNYLCPGLEALNKASNGKSIIFQESKENPSLDSEYLDKMISDAIKHNEKCKDIKQLSTEAYQLRHYFGLHILENRLSKELSSYPLYSKNFFETLSEDEKRQLESTIMELTKNIKNNNLPSEVRYLHKVFYDHPSYQKE